MAVPRVIDLRAVVPAALGRIEFDLLEEGRELDVVEEALGRALLRVWRRHLTGVDLEPLVRRFEEEGLAVATGDLAPGRDVLAAFGDRIDGLATWIAALGEDEHAEDPELAASVVEFVLEGLYLGRRLSRHDLDPTTVRYGG